MKKSVLLLLVSSLLFVFSLQLFAQPIQYHGANFSFRTDNIAVVWAILKGPEISSSKVYIDIVPLDSDKDPYVKYSVIAANVFTGEEQAVVSFKTLKEENLVVQEYGSFSRMAKRRILFFGKKDKKDNSALEIYYIGVPDTTPEFLTEDQVKSFFEHSLQKLRSE